MNKIVLMTKSWLNLPKTSLDLYQKVWLFAPVFIWFSYHPVIKIGSSETMNLELSLALIYVAILALVGLPKIWRARQSLIKNRAVWLVGVFVLWQLVTLIWGVNLARGVLTSGVAILLSLIFLSCLAEAKNIKKILPSIIKIFITSAVVMSFLALVQIIAGIWLGRSETLLCAGCVAEQFGFVRPNVFTIEPQFFGSLLLAPLLILQYFILTKKSNWQYNLSFGFLLMTLILTLSRGAIFAFGLGVVVLFILNLRNWRRILINAGVMILGLVVALIIQGSAAVVNPNFNERFSQVIAKSIHQLSMGAIDFRQENTDISNGVEEYYDSDQPAFDGYVPESTDVRVNLSKVAIETWSQNPERILFGVGLGGAGVAMANLSPNQGPREIVQNEYVEVLLERGLIGAGLLAAILFGYFYAARCQKWTWAIIAAFLLQWNFFSGLPNALHIYLIMIVLFVYVEDNIISHRGRGRTKPAKTS